MSSTLTMENLGDCSVCFTTFDESERRPRTLPCGHTFCSPCLGDMMKDGQLSCPTCRVCHPTTSVTQFPISYITEAFVKQLKLKVQEAPGGTEATVRSGITGAVGQKQSKGLSIKMLSLLDQQMMSVKSRVEERQMMQIELDQYHTHLVTWRTQHLHLQERLHDLVKENKATLELLEQEDTRVLDANKDGEKGEKQLVAVLVSLNDVSTIQEAIISIEHAEESMLNVEEEMQKHESIFFPDCTITTCGKEVLESTKLFLEAETAEAGHAEAPFILLDPSSDLTTKLIKFNRIIAQKGELHIKDLCSLRQPFKRLLEAGHVFGVQKEGGFRSSKITLGNGRLYLHCLQDKPLPPKAQTLPVSEVVGVLDPSSTLVFLDLSWPGSRGRKGRVHIRLSPDTSLARQFVLLCTGQQGISYLNTNFLQVVKKGYPGEGVWCGDYQYNNGTGGAPLLPHPDPEYRESCKEGTVWSLWGPDTDQSAQFAITTRVRTDNWAYTDVFGQVESGLHLVKSAILHHDIKEVTVVGCGVVVPL